VVLVGHDYTKQLSLLFLYMVLSIAGNVQITNIGTQLLVMSQYCSDTEFMVDSRVGNTLTMQRSLFVSRQEWVWCLYGMFLKRITFEEHKL
jgi:hypothetical protein